METGDAFGAMLLDHLEGRPAHEIVERDDGYVRPAGRRPGTSLPSGAGRGWSAAASGSRAAALSTSAAAPAGWRSACRTRRRGRGDRRLPGRGRGVPPPGRPRRAGLGARRRRRAARRLRHGRPLRQQLRLLESRRTALRTLRRLHSATSARGRILAESLDWSKTEDPAHRAYHERNRRRGRLPGQNRIRIRHGLLATPWFDYLLVTPAEMAELATASGWKLARALDEPDPAFALYLGVLEKG